MLIPEKTVTLADIAKRAKVAIKTASKVFNGDPSIRPALKARVLEEANKVNFRPNPLAQAIRLKKLNLISFHIANMETPLFGALFEKVSILLGLEMYMVVPCDGMTSINETNQATYACASILANADIKKIKAVVPRGPLITIDCYQTKNNLCSGVYNDFEWAYQNMTRKVIEFGRKKIGYMCPMVNAIKPFKQRKYNYINETLKEFGLETSMELNNFTDYDCCIDQVLKKKYDAIFCDNDTVAVSLMLRAQRKGLSIPEDLLVIGCDGHLLDPNLWTILISVDDIAKFSVQLLLDALHGNKSIQHIGLRPELITPGLT